jgi:hypothetical protein
MAEQATESVPTRYRLKVKQRLAARIDRVSSAA